MGNAQPSSFRRKQSKNAAIQRFEDMHPDYQTSYRLLSELVVDQNKRRLLAKLEEEEAQAMVDFLNRVLERQNFQRQAISKEVLHTLANLTRTAQVFPECLKLEGIKCEFDSALHNGSFGDIYRGNFGDQAVCVKVIRKSQVAYTPEQLLKVLAKEAIISAHMSHANILPFYGVYLCSDDSLKVCIISPWMEHGDLLKYLRSFPKAPRIPLMSDIICGLAYMHELGIIHSDLKAKNVLVCEEGRAVLADFGASRVIAATQSLASVGEAHWLSPELLTGYQSVPTPESDVWSYACTCYEVITDGAKPFNQYRSILALASAFEKGHVTPTRPVAGLQVDDTVWKKMEQCWAKEPKERPAAATVRKFFVGLCLKGDHHESSDQRPSIRVDRTIIDDFLVFKTLQRVQKTDFSAEGN